MNIYENSEITVHELNKLREDDKKIQILDVREDTERIHASIKGSKHIKHSFMFSFKQFSLSIL